MSANSTAHLEASPLRRSHLGAHLSAGASAGRRKPRYRRLPALSPRLPGPPAATMSASAVFILDVKGKVGRAREDREGRTGEAALPWIQGQPLRAGGEAPESSGSVGTPLPQSLEVPGRIPPPLFTNRVRARDSASLSLSLPFRKNGNTRGPHPRRMTTTR